MTARSELELTPMVVPKAADVLAHELRDRIISGELAEDAVLPPERVLVEQSGLSRATVREALRILQAEGLVAIKAGRAGGAFVQRPSGRFVANSVNLVIRGQRLDLDILHETREVIEPACAALAAKRRSSADLDELDAAHADLVAAGSNSRQFLGANIRWHEAVAAASGNDLLIGFMSGLSEAIYAAGDLDTYVADPHKRELTAMAHSSVTEAIRAGDSEAAMRRMARHVHATATISDEWDRRQGSTSPTES